MTYEMHITVTPLSAEEQRSRKFNYETFVEASKKLGWKASMFDHDDVDGIAGKWFITSHASHYGRATSKLASMARELETGGLTVERAKIEHIVFDTKRGDAL